MLKHTQTHTGCAHKHTLMAIGWRWWDHQRDQKPPDNSFVQEHAAIDTSTHAHTLTPQPSLLLLTPHFSLVPIFRLCQDHLVLFWLTQWHCCSITTKYCKHSMYLAVFDQVTYLHSVLIGHNWLSQLHDSTKWQANIPGLNFSSSWAHLYGSS